MNIYPASKFAVTALTETIRQELVIAGNKKIRVTVSLSLISKLTKHESLNHKWKFFYRRAYHLEQLQLKSWLPAAWER